MSPWEVIEEALLHKRPVRNLQWLADQLGVSAQVVSNWKARGVPAKRYRDVASAIGVTLDQLEGLEPLPWLRVAQQSDLSEEVQSLASEIDRLPKKQRDWVLMTLREAVKIAHEMITETAVATSHQNSEHPSSARRRAA
jgi:DNA-binding transcriptional regulator YdaS (Cro superfamily)